MTPVARDEHVWRQTGVSGVAVARSPEPPAFAARRYHTHSQRALYALCELFKRTSSLCLRQESASVDSHHVPSEWCWGPSMACDSSEAFYSEAELLQVNASRTSRDCQAASQTEESTSS